MTNQPPTWAHLDQPCPFSEFFPDGRVPIESLWPIRVIRNGASRICYIVDWKRLTDDQLAGLAIELTKVWKPECTTVEAAVAYICETGLPMDTYWFSGAIRRGRKGDR